jgi:hypothetical protein
VLEEHPHGPLPNLQAALFYNLIESAKLAGIEPSVHLGEATRRAIQTPGTVPWAWTAHQANKIVPDPNAPRFEDCGDGAVADHQTA